MPNARGSGRRSLLLTRRLVTALLLASALPACDALEQAASNLTDRSAAFAGIAVGTSGADRKTVIATMGSPKNATLGNLAGLELEVLKFEDRKSQYTVTLFNGHAWTKLSTPRAPANATVKEK